MSSAPVYDPAEPKGGDTLTTDVNLQYAGFEFHYVYLVFCGFIVWLIIPGIGLLYAGLARRKSSLSLMFQSLMVAAVVTVQWMFWGYTLAFSRTAGPFIGNFANFGLRGVGVAPSPGSSVIPEVVYMLYQMFFCACTVQIVIGGAFERGRILPTLVFAFLWPTIVYSVVAEWTWNANGFLAQLPSLDFAGGGVVHISSGWAGLAYAMVLGKRVHAGEKSQHKPHNVTLVFLGTVLIWFGWFGFNGGSALNASVRAVYAATNTNIAASTGVLGWVLVDYIRTRGKYSMVGACQGAIAGLVGITPAAGFVSFWPAALIGFLTAIVCALLQDVNKWLRIDEGLEVFKLHGIGGMMGSFLTGIFADQAISRLDGVSFAPGGINGNAIQVGKQFAEITAISAYSFVVTALLLTVLKYIPGMHLRVSEEEEIRGLDKNQFCDEEIGDWEFFNDLSLHGMPQAVLSTSSAVSVEASKTD